MPPMTPPERKKRKQYKLEKRTQLTKAPPFTTERVRTILKDAGCTVPGDAETTKLCGILNFWHGHFYRVQEEQKFDVLAADARAAFDMLIEVMPAIRNDLVKRDAVAEGRDPYTTQMLRHICALQPCLSPTATGFLQPYDMPAYALDWRWLAKVLPIDIEAAIRPTNPKYRGGKSKGGPLSRILAAIIPSVTGEKVTAIAIGNQLRILQKE